MIHDFQSHVRIQVAADGYDPNIGHLHAAKPDRPALVFDLMEPLRPIADRRVLEFVQSRISYPADFIIRSDGMCRLNPEMAKHVIAMVATTDNYRIKSTLKIKTLPTH
jgi:CRISP-associated protein Cas1